MTPKLVTTDPSILLHPNIPRPLHGVTPRTILGKKWWDETRKEAYALNYYHCMACGVWKHDAKGHKWLEGHEWYEVDYFAGEAYYTKTVALCNHCHCYIHDGRLESMVQAGKVSQAKFVAVIQHGDEVLSRVGLKRPTRIEREEEMSEAILKGQVAKWQDWRLILNGKRYPPKFKSEAQWRAVVGK